MKATQTLHEQGQSLWLDNITRGMLDSGQIQHYIDKYSITGLTSNPSIFDKAIESGYGRSRREAAVRRSEAVRRRLERPRGKDLRTTRRGHLTRGEPTEGARLGETTMTTRTPMRIGMVGPGRMGGNLVRRLMRDGHRCIGGTPAPSEPCNSSPARG